MRIAIYARVSKEETNEKGRMYQEPKNQLEPLRDYAKQMKWEVVEEFIDRKSGADSNRLEFQRMLNMIRQRRFDLILVWAIDRFSREPILNTLKYLETLKLNNVHLKSLTDNIDTRELSNTGELIMIIMMWLAKEERAKISRRTKAGIQRRKNLGVWRGGRPNKKGGI